MRFLISPRGSGKTTKAIEELYYYENSVLIVPDMTTAIQLRQQNPLVQPHRIVPATHIESLRGRNVGKVVVDELEQVLFYLLGHEVSMVTGTDEDPVNYQPNEKKENVTPIFGEKNKKDIDELVKTVIGVYTSVYDCTFNKSLAERTAAVIFDRYI